MLDESRQLSNPDKVNFSGFDFIAEGIKIPGKFPEQRFDRTSEDEHNPCHLQV